MCDNHTVIDNDAINNPKKFKNLDMSSDLRMIIVESIISNTDARIETNDETCRYEAKG